MKKNILLTLFTSALVLVVVNGKILQTDVPGSAAINSFPNTAVGTTKFSPVKEKRDRFLGDGSFTLGYSTKFNYGGLGGYPGIGFQGYGHGHFGHGHHGYYPSFGLGYGHYDSYFGRPYHHHQHLGGYSGGFGFKHHFHQHGGYHNFGYPHFY